MSETTLTRWRAYLAGARRMQAMGEDRWCTGSLGESRCGCGVDVLPDLPLCVAWCALGHVAVAAGITRQAESPYTWLAGRCVADVNDDEGFYGGLVELRIAARLNIPESVRARLAARKAARERFDAQVRDLMRSWPELGRTYAKARVVAQRRAREAVDA